MKKLLVLVVSVLVIIGLSPITFAPPNPNADLSDRGPLTKIVFIHYKKGFGHKPNHNPGGNGNTEGPPCYVLLAKDAKWKTIENAQVNPTNSGLGSDFLVTNTLSSREVWDTQTSQELFGDTISVNTSADWDGDTGDSPDGLNEYSFGVYSDPNVIAVTVVWGYFSAPPPFREIIEYDVLFNTAFVWGDATVNNSTMDYLNIATHETGHGAGLGDVYDVVCTEVTMFGFSTEGETKKRTLAAQDINGLHKLYPA